MAIHDLDAPRMLTRRKLLAILAALGTVIGAAVLFACSQTPTSVPIRTFERAQKVDVLCLRVFGSTSPDPLPQEACAPVPPDINGGNLDNQLFALVTQTSRGEVAVVDLSAGALIDQSHGVPGVNFLPVGALPTDIASTPDGRMAFVASAEPNKFAIYGLPGHRILGDAAGRRDPEGSVTLASWPVCTLPQRPGSLTVVPRRATSVAPADAGSDAGADAGTGTTNTGGLPLVDVPYELVAVLPGDRTTPAKVITIDPVPFLRGSPRRDDAKNPIERFSDGPVLTPGQLAPCPITSAIELTSSDVLPKSFTAGALWDDGVKYVDGGVDLTCASPDKPLRCGLRPCKCGGSADAGAGSADAGAGADGGTTTGGAAATCDPDAGSETAPTLKLDLGPLDPPQPVAIARDDQTLYVADDGVPLIHVIDLSTPGEPKELPPFIVTSTVDPSRAVSIRDIAISPATREYKRFLYAVDRKEGSLAIFDVTDPKTADRFPLRRPHPELNPFQPPDRIAFGAPVVSVAFARHDFPLARINGVQVLNAKSGLLCNPNPNLDPQNNPADLGVYYRAASTDQTVDIGPGRLRGVFAFATLSNGQIVAIDVDDWDAPCRRPLTLTGSTSDTGLSVGSLAAAQPAPGPGDFDPYHAPVPPPESVTQEVFFPVSAPHRIRSTYFLRDDSVTGKHLPFLPSTPSIQSTGAPLPLFGQGSESTPRMRPTAVSPGVFTGSEDVGIRFSLDVPDVHFDQDWTVTYEGAIPGFDGLSANLSTPDAYASLVLEQPQARFCAKGVEDWAVGGERANAITNALAAAGRPTHPERLDRRMADYVQIVDELLPSDDPFWAQDDLPVDGCWDPQLNTPNKAANAAARVAACTNVFGTVAQQSTSRDFPILEAYDDRLVVGRFAKIGQNESREIIYSDTSNAPYLKLMRCCFHNQVHFKVRSSAQWVTVGSAVGLLSHLTRGEGGRCVPSCESRESLLNGRAPSLPFGAGDFAPFRDSPLAMRNPAFSFFVQNGQKDSKDVLPTRDTVWVFQTRGQFQPLVVNLAATTTAVNPQSMRFIESLGQIAVVDGASQGLVLIDLAGVTIARAPYF